MWSSCLQRRHIDGGSQDLRPKSPDQDPRPKTPSKSRSPRPRDDCDVRYVRWESDGGCCAAQCTLSVQWTAAINLKFKFARAVHHHNVFCVFLLLCFLSLEHSGDICMYCMQVLQIQSCLQQYGYFYHNLFFWNTFSWHENYPKHTLQFKRMLQIKYSYSWLSMVVRPMVIGLDGWHWKGKRSENMKVGGVL